MHPVSFPCGLLHFIHVTTALARLDQFHGLVQWLSWASLSLFAWHYSKNGEHHVIRSQPITRQNLCMMCYNSNYITDIQILVIWLVEFTSRAIHCYSHPHRRSKRPIRPWGIVFPIQQLGSSLFPMFLSSRAPLLKQRSTCAKCCEWSDQY